MGKILEIKNREGTGGFCPKELYAWRMARKEVQIKKWTEQGKLTPERLKKVRSREEEIYNWTIQDAQQVEKLNKGIAIIVPSHVGHIPWLRACLESCKETGFFILLAYDNPFWRVKNYDKFLLPSVMGIADSVIIKQRTFQVGVGPCHLWNMVYGLTLLKEMKFPLVFSINGDCVMERPDGIHKIIEMLGDADLFPCHYEENRPYSGTMGWIGKTDIMLDFFHTYRKEAYMYSRTTEGRLWYYIKEKKLNIVKPVNCPEFFKIPSPGTWYDILGFRHIHAEWKVRPTLGMKPVEEKYMDFN